MHLFLLLLLPLALAVYLSFTKDSKNILVIFMGLVAAVLVGAYKIFISSSHRLVPFSFGQNFLYFFLIQSFVPAAVLYLVFFLFVKDDVEFKIRSFFPLEATFFSVFLPYCIISSSTITYTSWSLFVKPALYLAMLTMQASTLWFVYKNITNKKILFAILSSLFFIAYSVLPAILEALYVIKESYLVIGVISSIYIILPLLTILFHFARPRFIE